MRFQAAMMALLLVVALLLGATGLAARAAAPASFGWFAYQPLAKAAFFPGALSGWQITGATVIERALDPAFLLLSLVAALFCWGTLSPRSQPFTLVFARVIAPRLAPAHAFDDPRPVRFAQGVGLVVTLIGMLLHLAGVPLALPIAAAIAFVATFLKAAFGICLGCRLYLLLIRLDWFGIQPPRRREPRHPSRMTAHHWGCLALPCQG